MDRGPITLALGPTNTGKTHRAVERLLEAESGMIGLPLRLLAREVYDRLTAEVGERDVALVTGEEKRVPARPRYWVCTVEAMPEVEVDVLVVDEIQLAAHRERGHVFTDRLLHARGRIETWFLGADTMAPILAGLLPGAELRRQTRFSTLRHVGGAGLGGIPPRSATVAFSADEVYRLAGRLKGRRGGAAVVLGALSPRTRNAQVALYQAREVQHLVATDAIGMGLNLDIDHVAFAAREKFDGAERRPLSPAEIGQIAGRAGRHRKDGTFGTLRPASPLPDGLARAVEEHRFEPVRRLVWRSRDLDFGSLDALIASLSAPAPDERFSRVERADDFDALRDLARREAIAARATDDDRRALLWEVCQVPDYRKLLLLRHVSLLAALYEQLVDRGRLDPDFVEAHVRRIDRIDGEVDHLTARLAAIRVWTYISQRSGWLEDPARWRERTRLIEDRLGDALHARLVERFVERTRTTRAAAPVEAAGPFASLGTLLAERQAEERARETAWIEDVVAAEHAQITVDAAGEVRAFDRPLARLLAGRDPNAVALTLTLDDEVGAGARARIERRLVAWSRDWVAELLAPLDFEAEGALRGLAYQLVNGLGAVSRRDARPQVDALDELGREALDARGIVIGRRTVYALALLDPEAMRRRALLVRLHGGPSVDPADRSVPRARGVPFETWLRAGFLPVGPRALRVDVLERALAGFADGADVTGDLGVPDDDLDAVLRALGYRRADDAITRTGRRRRRSRR